LKLQAFKKESSCLFGFIIKTVFLKENLGNGGDPAWNEFSFFMTDEEFKEGLRVGSKLWKNIYYIHCITIQKEKRVSEKLQT
jgi:hypothetical protein